MNTHLEQWAAKWAIPPQAFAELCASALHLLTETSALSEGYLQSLLRLEAARKGRYLFRNNRGAGAMKKGGFVRWGLANDSLSLNDRFKSADLIGIEPVIITPEMAGQIIGRFLSVEVKRGDWKFAGTAEEHAQVAWATLINSQGGRAIITNRLDSI